MTLAGLGLREEVGSVAVVGIPSGRAASAVAWTVLLGHGDGLPGSSAALPRSYDSNLNVSRDDKKNKFASTMEFVEDYLNNVVSEAVPFANEEKNKLTFEVRVLLLPRPIAGHSAVWLQQ